MDALRGILANGALGGGAAGPQQNGISHSLLESLTRQQQQQSSMTELQRAILRGAATTTTTDPTTASLSPLSSSLNQSLIGGQSNLSNNSMAVSIALQNLLQKKQGT